MSSDSSPPAIGVCPECGVTGRKVGLVTLQTLLTEDAREGLTDSESYRFCKSRTCAVVYFGEREPTLYHRPDVRVPVFQKSSEPSRLVCYCFEHKISDIEDEVRRTGASSIPDAIGQKCKAGLDRCEEMNPQGSCYADATVLAQSTQVTRTYTIAGMTCEGCAAHVKDAVEGTPGVASAELSYEKETLRVLLDPDLRVTDAQIIAAVEALGYRATRKEGAG